MESEIKGT